MKLIISIIILIAIFWMMFIFDMKYVTGDYSRYCYEYGHENKNIRNKIYFKTLEECNKPLKK